ncbi:MAG: hypothetical protein HY017_21705 [Betaproteobacteria bacterium]|nr:hypothetical protein [Betaproteobacteria bacterium]
MTTTPHRWRFFRTGGFDQVRIDTPAELLALAELDQKLWVALSCPVNGIEFDAATLAMVDSDSDGRVRAAELIGAVRWAGERLKNHAALAGDQAGVPASAIRDDDEEGAAIAAAARALLADRGKGNDAVITVEDASAAHKRFAEKAVVAWQATGQDARPLGDATEAAFEAMNAVLEKVQDYFTRCRLAAFDERAGSALNVPESAFQALGNSTLKADAAPVAALPLARAEANRPLPLDGSVNPAWALAIRKFHDATVVPLLGARENLTEADWQSLTEKLASYSAWLAAKPAEAPEGEGLKKLERLARYCRDLMTLANNFVAFKDFYTRQGKATFQVGTLYLDGRSADLCVAVNDPTKHSALATLSRICLVYCDCVRGAEKRTIAAAFTAGDSDQLMVGRNGVFYDRQGRDWDATIAKIIDHPISLRQAFWMPYRKAARMIAEQAQKFAANRAAASDARMMAAAVAGKPPPPPAPFDVAKFAGIFAAIGLAVGALGAAAASVITGLLALKWWQTPLAIAGLLLLVSGPAVVLAWFKLRSRNLGPILDANGWAINSRARINIPFGTSLTQLATLPPGAERSLTDPYAEKETPWGTYLAIAAVVALMLFWSLRTG